MGGAHDAPAHAVDLSVRAQKIAPSEALKVDTQWNLHDFKDCIDYDEDPDAAGDARPTVVAAVTHVAR